MERFSCGEKKLFLPAEKSLPKEEIKILSRTYKQGEEGGRGEGDLAVRHVSQVNETIIFDVSLNRG